MQVAVKVVGLDVGTTAMGGQSGEAMSVSLNVTVEVGDVPAAGIAKVAVKVKGWFTKELPWKGGEVTTVVPCK
jgi:hypothetical protein